MQNKSNRSLFLEGTKYGVGEGNVLNIPAIISMMFLKSFRMQRYLPEDLLAVTSDPDGSFEVIGSEGGFWLGIGG